MTMSNITEHGVSEVKATACDKLLATRVDARVSGNKVEGVMNRLQVFHPAPRDNVQRDAYIPPSVKQAITEGTIGSIDHKPKRSRIGYAHTVDDENGDDDSMEDTTSRKTARDLMWENGGPGVWAPDYREQYDLKDEDWRFDAIPEIIDGKNIADYVDPDIEKKLADLEAEEEQLLEEIAAQQMGEEPESDLDSEEEAAVEAIRDRKSIVRKMSQANRSENKPVIPRTIRGRAKDKHQPGARNADVIKSKMDKLGVDSSKLIKRGRSLDRDRGRKRERSRKDAEKEDDEAMVEGPVSNTQAKKQKRSKSEAAKREASITRGHSRARDPSQKGLGSEEAVKAARKLDLQGRKQWEGGAGEGDNRKAVHLVQWMNTGKKRNGTHYCR
jgi:nucleolar GTP-binding protein